MNDLAFAMRGRNNAAAFIMTALAVARAAATDCRFARGAEVSIENQNIWL